MKLNIIVLLVQLRIVLMHSEIIQTKSYFPVTEKNNQLSKITVKIMNCCFDKKNFFLITDSNSTDGNISHFLLNFPAPLYIFDTHHESVFKKRQRFQKIYAFNETHESRRIFPVTGVAITITSGENFALILLRMKNSIWWNHQAQFLLINGATDGCQKANTFLQTLWTYNVLSAIYLCNKLGSDVAIYTFNPYSQAAPKFWKQVQVESSPNVWTMFELAKEQLLETLLNNQTSNTSLCSILFYDKIRNLENYNLKMVTFNDSGVYRYNEKKSGFQRCDSAKLMIMCTILEHIGATVTVKILNSSFTRSLDLHGESAGPIRDMTSNTVDIMAVQSVAQDFWSPQLYPFYSNGIKIISLKFSGKNRKKNRFFHFLKLEFWIYFTLCCCSCVIATKYILNTSLLDAALEFVRIFCGTSSPKQPNKFISRILFMMVFIIIFTFNSSFHSRLHAICTVPDPLLLIESAVGLIKSNLSIYGYASYKEMISYDLLRDRFHVYDSPSECAKRLLKGDNIACLMSDLAYPYYLSENKSIHISKKNIAEKYISYTFKEDSPLLYKFNFIMARLCEGGFIKLLLDREKLHHVKNLSDIDLPKPINCRDLRLIFFILLGGWILAVFTFYSEICVFQLRRAVKKSE